MKATKTILIFLTVTLLSVVSGKSMADAADLNPLLVIGITTGLGIFVQLPAGSLAMAVNITSIYAGEVLEQLLVRASTGNQLVSGGHIHVQPNVNKKFVIPRLRASNMLQKRKEQPVEEDSLGDFTIDERYLEPKDFMAFTTFNPRAFEAFWRPFQPTGNLVFRELPAEVQNQMLAELAKVVDFQLGGEFINGEFSPAEGDFFDGILTRLVADENVIVVPGPVGLTQANIISKMKVVRSLIPKAIRNHPNLKYFMSVRDAESYEYELTDKPSKGADYTNMNPERFKGIKIVPLADWPDDVIVAAVTSSGIDSNFWAGVAYADDAEAIQIDKLTNAGEKYFFKMLMKADTNVVFPEDVVLYDGRAAAVLAGTTELDGLVFSAGDLDPVFDAETRAYTIEVANAVDSTTITVDKKAAGQVCKVGTTTLVDGVASAAKALAVGENTFSVKVTSADGLSMEIYEVIITRAAAA
jgi:hypothetical protein